MLKIRYHKQFKKDYKGNNRTHFVQSGKRGLYQQSRRWSGYGIYPQALKIEKVHNHLNCGPALFLTPYWETGLPWA